jgi:hypothetical protein
MGASTSTRRLSGADNVVSINKRGSLTSPNSLKNNVPITTLSGLPKRPSLIDQLPLILTIIPSDLVTLIVEYTSIVPRILLYGGMDSYGIISIAPFEDECWKHTYSIAYIGAVRYAYGMVWNGELICCFGSIGGHDHATHHLSIDYDIATNEQTKEGAWCTHSWLPTLGLNRYEATTVSTPSGRMVINHCSLCCVELAVNHCDVVIV